MVWSQFYPKSSKVNDLYLLLHLHVGMRSQKPLPMLYQPPTLLFFLVMCNIILRNLIRSCIGGKGDETTIKDQCAGHSLRLKSLFTGPTLGHRDLFRVCVASSFICQQMFILPERNNPDISHLTLSAVYLTPLTVEHLHNIDMWRQANTVDICTES